MNRTALVRALLASAATAAAVALGSCNTDGLSENPRAMKPLSSEMVSLLEQKHMPKESPILVRVFKEESEFEVWKQDDTGNFALLKTYPICRWSGDLGPKIHEGDRQAPEGFYTITPGQMNPNSNYYLSFNLGFPNAFDKANDRTGAFLMVHGDCSSAGCYAMTDEQMGEIYALGRESFFGGQRAFQVQAYPFHMTPLNLAKHRNSPHLAFWRMIKQGNDIFEVTRQEPKVDVCEKHYVFNATPPQGSTTALAFNPKGHCPAYEIPADVAAAVKEKRENDDREFAALVSRGTPVVASRSGVDGGMNPIFAAKLKPNEVFDAEGRVHTNVAAAPASIPPNVNPPDPPTSSTTAQRGLFSTASTDTKSITSPAANSASPTTTQNSGGENPLQQMTSTVSKWVGLSSDPPPPPPEPAVATTAPKPKPKPTQIARQPQPPHPNVAQPAAPPVPATPTAAAPTPQQQQQMAGFQQSSGPPPAPRNAPPAPASPPAAAMAPAEGTITGAQPVVPASTFDSRWGGMR